MNALFLFEHPQLQPSNWSFFIHAACHFLTDLNLQGISSLRTGCWNRLMCLNCVYWFHSADVTSWWPSFILVNISKLFLWSVLFRYPEFHCSRAAYMWTALAVYWRTIRWAAAGVMITAPGNPSAPVITDPHFGTKTPVHPSYSLWVAFLGSWTSNCNILSCYHYL